MIFLFPLILTGCWNYAEIQRLSNVTGFAIDKGEEGKTYKVTVEVVEFETAKDYKVKAILTEIKCDSIFEAIRKMVTVFAKKMYIGHSKIIIISEEIAKEGIFETLDFFIRDHESRATMKIFIAKGTTAASLLKDTAVYSNVAAFEIEKIIENDEIYSSYSRKRGLYQVVNSLLSRGVSLTLPVLELIDFNDQKTFKLSGIACFKEDKLIDYIDFEKVKYFLGIVGEYKGGVFILETEKNGKIIVEDHDSKTKAKVKVEQGKIVVEIEIKMKVGLGEKDFDYKNKDKKVNDEEIKELTTKEWTTKIQELFVEVRDKMKSDIFGFGRLLMGKSYKEWLEYKDKISSLEDVELKIKMEVDVVGAGLVSP
jgi:spore germination protein KC